MTGTVANELSRPIELADIGVDEHRIDVVVTDDERAALSRRFGLVSIDRMTATVVVKRLADDAVRLRVTFTAYVVQRCVVTLDPIETRVEGDETLLLLRPDADKDEIDVDPTADEPEPLLGDTIDIGEAVAQQLGLSIDPYPRKPGIEFKADSPRPGEDEDDDSPFAALRGLTVRRGDGPRG